MTDGSYVYDFVIQQGKSKVVFALTGDESDAREWAAQIRDVLKDTLEDIADYEFVY
jgi:hypothetical protein